MKLSVLFVYHSAVFVFATQNKHREETNPDWPLSVLNYSQFTHQFRTISLVEVLHRLGNLTTSGLGDKIILLCCKAPCQLALASSNRRKEGFLFFHH